LNLETYCRLGLSNACGRRRRRRRSKGEDWRRTVRKKGSERKGKLWTQGAIHGRNRRQKERKKCVGIW
jgi:hypothetical protein